MEKKKAAPLQFLIKGIGLFIACYLAGKLGRSVYTVTDQPPLLWAPSGLALAAFLILGSHYWIWIFLASFLVSFNLNDYSFLSSSLIAVGSTFGCWMGASLFKRFSTSRPTFSTLQEVFAFIFLTMGVGCGISSFSEVTGLYLIGTLSADHFFITFRTWWIGQAMGNLVVGAFIINFWNDSRFRLRNHFEFKWEMVLLVCLLLVTTALIFTPLAEFNHSLIVRPYLLFTLILWSALRFDLFGSTLASVLIVGTAFIGALMGFEPFPKYAPEERLVLAQYLISAVTSTGLVLASAVREKSRAVEARNEFLSIASHELKTPITSLKLKLQITQKRIQALPEKDSVQMEQLEFLSTVNKQINRLVQIVDQLLDVSQAERKTIQLSPDDFNLSSLIVSMLDRLSADLANANCKLETTLQSDIECHWDPNRIEQVLENILTNAIKYAKGTLIQIQTKQIGENVKIVIQDHGPGIEPSRQAFIFDRFVRASDSLYVSGLGLGLFISKQIVRAHGGSIEVKSKLGQGTSFIITIPAKRDKLVASETQNPVPSHLL